MSPLAGVPPAHLSAPLVLLRATKGRFSAAAGEKEDFLLQELRRRNKSREEKIVLASSFCLGTSAATAEEYTRMLTLACSKLCFWEVALAAVREMRQNGIETTIGTNLVLVDSFGKTKWAGAIHELSSMQCRGTQQSSALCKRFLGLLEQSSRWRQALHLLKAMDLSDVPPDINDYSAVATSCDKSRAKGAQRVRQALLARVNLLIERTQMVECERQGLWDEALKILREMRAAGLPVTAQERGVVLRSCGKLGRWQLALSFFQNSQQQEAFQPDEESYGWLIGACVECGKWDVAVLLFQEMKGKGLSPARSTYAAVVEACVAGGQWQWAVSLLRELMSAGVVAGDGSLYHTVMRACKEAGEWKWTITLLQDMQDGGLTPDVGTYLLAILACEENGQGDWVHELRSEMSSVHGSRQPVVADARWRVALENLREAPADENLHRAFSACTTAGEWERALAVLEDLRTVGSQLDGTDFTMAISACKKSWQHAMALLFESQDRGFQLPAAVYNAVARSCLEAREPTSSLAVIDEMQQRGLEPEVDLYSEALSAADIEAPKPRPKRRLRKNQPRSWVPVRRADDDWVPQRRDPRAR